jgi:hypothetical protein
MPMGSVGTSHIDKLESWSYKLFYDFDVALERHERGRNRVTKGSLYPTS